MKDTSSIGDGFWLRGTQNSNRGPCGIPRNVFGTSPFIVGVGTAQNYCKSDPEDCARCPMNPNIRKDTPGK